MYNKIKIISFVVALVTISFPLFVSAQESNQGEVISSFVSTIKVNTDSSIDVNEVITYNTGGEEHHGIYRDIRRMSSLGGKMKISDIKVVNEKGEGYDFALSQVDDSLRIKIGDADVTFSGEKIYSISYHAANAVAPLEGLDEIYWNVTGNDWNMPIDEAKAIVILPNGATSNQYACYFGESGSDNECQLNGDSKNNVYIFDAPNKLNKYEGLTVAVGFPKGIVTPYKESFLDKYGILIVSIVIFLIVFSLTFRYWYRNWRDPKGTGIIVAQYDVLDGLTPVEVSGIVNEKINSENLSSEIIYLATQGYLKIKQIDTSVIGVFKSTDYELIDLKKNTDSLGDFDKKLLSGIFSYNKEVVKLSDLKNVFYKKIPNITDSAADSILEKGYYKNLGKIKNDKSWILPFAVFFSFFIPIFFGAFVAGLFLTEVSLTLMIGIFSSLMIIVVFWYFSPAKTEKGVAAKEYLLGLKEYLQIAEKDRLAFHNAPEKKPEIFEKLLPYAMIFGVDELWAKEFEDIYTTPPDWYEGTTGSHFSAVAFNSSISNFRSSSLSSLSSSPSSGGSGGGGSSGGGGGGGGGGSW